jgi:DNA-binding PadR family transcriptional regulator
MKGEHLGEFEELVLLAVRRLDSEATGSAIQALLAEQARRRPSLGAIYAALDRAERKRLIRSWLGDPKPVAGGRARRHYALTRAGEGVLRESRQIRERLRQEAPGTTP